tara:strand:+ start:4588 stop:5010 length:423 start_codon:yes stop_codon:yes gene_type:complete
MSTCFICKKELNCGIHTKAFGNHLRRTGKCVKITNDLWYLNDLYLQNIEKKHITNVSIIQKLKDRQQQLQDRYDWLMGLKTQYSELNMRYNGYKADKKDVIRQMEQLGEDDDYGHYWTNPDVAAETRQLELLFSLGIFKY